MARQRLNAPVAAVQSADLPYNIRLEVNTAQRIKSSRAASKQSWAAWVGAAIARLQEEAPVEIESLIAQAQLTAGSRKDKISLPFRVSSVDVDIVRAMANQYNSNLQAVMIAAMHLYSFAAHAVMFDIDEAEAGE